MRISLDTKAKVKVGDFSRGGESRGDKTVKAPDHDMSADAVLAPFGLLELNRGAQKPRDPTQLIGTVFPRGCLTAGVKRVMDAKADLT